MPRKIWFKKLWDWKFKGKKLERKKRMRSFKITKINHDTSKIKIRCFDYRGNDLTHQLKHSYVYDGVPGGFYLDIH